MNQNGAINTNIQHPQVKSKGKLAGDKLRLTPEGTEYYLACG